MKYKLHDLILNDKFQIITTLIITFFSRLPFLSPGFGIDSDSWRIIRAANVLHDTGVYEVSRFPGFPIVEIGIVPFIEMEPLFVNIITAIFSTVMIYLLWLFLKEFKMKSTFFILITIALSPIILKNSVITMDYIWALTFMLAGLYLTYRNMVVLSGLMFGIAIGCRATSVLFLIPAIYLLYNLNPKQFLSNSIKIVCSTCIVGIVSFLPVMFTYGSEFLQIYNSDYPSLFQIIERLTVQVWDRLGVFALVSFFLGLIILPNMFRTRHKHCKEEKLLRNVSWIIVVIYLLLFILLPLEAEYFIPAIPFVIILFNYYLKKKLFYVYGSLTILASFIAPCLETPICNGMVISSFYVRQITVNQSNQFLKDLDNINEKAVVISGWYLPKVQYYSSNYNVENITFVYLLSKIELDEYISAGYAIYHLPGMDQYNFEVHGFLP